ncbi:MAG: hypothetical protein OMM_06286 [Candidatus Magnetoglobus multicellularis str. Araruama]|uniref:SAM-dependent MTase RsmB/NOP-type domain-containing protein n=1 Tax=Candidatus Magnetoglobus multicellularis str. Araruama TaxID=890399 RepID=A0A1V1PI49_9BACT|nr:MAG: hypothetical protein OMM_06286 [Candidatus Magnetoglobus multicellularis str. Araruama]
MKAGGTLIYAVCSLEPEETFQVIADFLSQNKTFQVDRQCQLCLKPFMDKNGYYIFRPNIHEMDGFFAVCLKKL